MLGERQAGRIIIAFRVEDIQFHGRQDFGGPEEARMAA
jgi:hypothetical protein